MASSDSRSGGYGAWGRLLCRMRCAVARVVTPLRLLVAGTVVVVGLAMSASIAVAGEGGRWLALPARLAADEVIVGLVLAAGQVPPKLDDGVQVGVLDTGGTEWPPRPLVARATAVRVEANGADARVALRVPAAVAPVVAAAAAQERIVLVKL